MPLRGHDGRKYDWCVLCQAFLEETLTTHLRRVHGCDLVPGCPRCFYFRSRIADVNKHCDHMHRMPGMKGARGSQGYRWALAKFESSYTHVGPEELMDYPRNEERLSARDRAFLRRLWPAVPLPATPEREQRIKKTPRRCPPSAAAGSAAQLPAQDQGHGETTREEERDQEQRSEQAPGVSQESEPAASQELETSGIQDTSDQGPPVELQPWAYRYSSRYDSLEERMRPGEGRPPMDPPRGDSSVLQSQSPRGSPASSPRTPTRRSKRPRKESPVPLTPARDVSITPPRVRDRAARRRSLEAVIQQLNTSAEFGSPPVISLDDEELAPRTADKGMQCRPKTANKKSSIRPRSREVGVQVVPEDLRPTATGSTQTMTIHREDVMIVLGHGDNFRLSSFLPATATPHPAVVVEENPEGDAATGQEEEDAGEGTSSQQDKPQDEQ